VQVSALAFDAPRQTAPFFNLEARREFTKTEEWIFSEGAMDRPEHEIEEELFQRSREINRKMLDAHIRARGQGKVGPTVEVHDETAQRFTQAAAFKNVMRVRFSGRSASSAWRISMRGEKTSDRWMSRRNSRNDHFPTRYREE
jgi:hypothetical protein